MLLSDRYHPLGCRAYLRIPNSCMIDNDLQNQMTSADEKENLQVESSRDSGIFQKSIRDILETVFLAMILFLAINTVSARIRVESISMEPTLYPGDFILVDRVSYHFSLPKIGDIVVFRYPPDPSQRFIKRVIGLPGDEIMVANGKVSVNGQVLDEPYTKSNPIYTGNWIVPNNSIFVLGDNRNRSDDSHVWGMVPLENLIGRSLFIYWPYKRAKVLIGKYTPLNQE
jgi:signal peptidase I